MGRFNRNDRSGGRGGRGDFGGGRSGGRPTMHHAVCDDCGNDCEVPFKPSNDKPIYCSDCFSNKGGGEPRRSGGRDRDRGDRRSDSRDRKMYDAICDDCGNDCQVPFSPSSDKPIFCDDCFGKQERKGRGGKGDGGKQFDEINAKLDMIMKVLQLDKATKSTKKDDELVVVKPAKDEEPKKIKAAAKPKAEAKPKKVAAKKKAAAKKTAAKKK